MTREAMRSRWLFHPVPQREREPAIRAATCLAVDSSHGNVFRGVQGRWLLIVAEPVTVMSKRLLVKGLLSKLT